MAPPHVGGVGEPKVLPGTGSGSADGATARRDFGSAMLDVLKVRLRVLTQTDAARYAPSTLPTHGMEMFAVLHTCFLKTILK